MSAQHPVITIDGPAGSGKSTTARMVAARLGFAYLDTGAMYRAAALLAARLNTQLENEGEVASMLARLDLGFAPPRPDDARPRVLLGLEDITDAIRTQTIDKLVSAISQHATVRAHMVELQRRAASYGKVVLEGRDTGTVVCPDADVKIYLDAALTERAMRRLRQRADGISSETISAEQSELHRRDRADSERELSPLKIADDAIIVDTSHMTIEQQVEKVHEICRRELGDH